MVAAKSPICLKFEMDRKHSLLLKSLATGKGLPAISQISLNFKRRPRACGNDFENGESDMSTLV